MQQTISHLEHQLHLAQQVYLSNRGTERETRDLALVMAIQAQLEHLREGEAE